MCLRRRRRMKWKSSSGTCARVMDTYLIDTNVISVLYDASRPNHRSIRRALAGFGQESVQLISAVTIAELRFGLALSRAAGRPMDHIEACIRSAEQHPLAEIGRYTGESFAYIKSEVAKRRLDIRRRIPRWVEGWTDRATGEKLQIDENDLWIAAQGLEKNFVVVTSDKDIRDIVGDAVPELRVEII